MQEGQLFDTTSIGRTVVWVREMCKVDIESGAMEVVLSHCPQS
jgi:hypothetical protein